MLMPISGPRFEMQPPTVPVPRRGVEVRAYRDVFQGGDWIRAWSLGSGVVAAAAGVEWPYIAFIPDKPRVVDVTDLVLGRLVRREMETPGPVAICVAEKLYGPLVTPAEVEVHTPGFPDADGYRTVLIPLDRKVED